MARRSLALFALLLASGVAAGQPRVGLVLGGGGARGAAHIGVLETLERLRVPVHCVAGTSMGGLVAGAWSSGINPAAMRAAMARTDWGDIFRDDADFAELDLRNKRMTQRFLPGSELGVGSDGQLSVPAGVVTGQKIKQFINQLVRADQRDHDISSTVLPLSLIATDIGTGERVVMRRGNLSQAMRASMSVPGLLAPTVIDGRKLVDGGLVDNLPVQEVMALCKPDVVIAVSVGTPLLPPDKVSSLLSVTTQMVGILTAQNVARSVALLRPADIFIQPDLGDISAADFERYHDAAERGRSAAELQAPRLQALALPEADYADWLTAFQTTAPPPPRVDAIEVAGLKQVDERAVSRHISQPMGQPLDAPQLRADLQNVYGDGDYENVDYSLVTRGGRNVLRVLPMEKSWGPDYLRFSLSLRSSRGEGSGYGLRAAYHRKLINSLGGELLAVGELGNRAGLSLEWYQPVDARRRFFFDVETSYRREEFFLDADDRRALQYQTQLASVGFAGGINLGTLGALRLGWHQTSQRSKLETGLPFLSNAKDHFGGLQATLDLDRLNDLHFPSHGWGLSANWFQANRDRGGYSKASVDARAAIPLGNFVIGGRLAATGSPRGELPLLEGASLGGFLNLSAYSPDQLLGDSSRYAHVRAERIIGRMPIGVRGDLRLGAALEVGRIGGNFAPTRHTGTLYSLTAYLGGETPLGPVYLAASYGGPGVVNAYLVIGQP